jgi:hypothetical protein
MNENTSRSADSTNDDDVEKVSKILTHCFISFGLGLAENSGVHEIAFEAATSLWKTYKPLFYKNMTAKNLKWEEKGDAKVLNAAYILGRVSGRYAYAKNEDRTLVKLEDLKNAMDDPEFQDACRNSIHPLGEWCA